MEKKKYLVRQLLVGSLFSFAWAFPFISDAKETSTIPVNQNNNEKTAVDERAIQEKDRNQFLVSFYKPNYFLPFYYTQSPYQSVYQNNTPDNESINSSEAKFQISFKVPIWQNIFNKRTNLYLAYTQLSYWQVYNDSEFFRESNYEPEMFLTNKFDWELIDGWKLSFLNLGVEHQSNGRGGNTERAWNRAYLEGILSKENCMISLKGWQPIARNSEDHNPDIIDFIGYERALMSYKYHQQVFSVEARNTVESGFSKGAVEIAWSFPLTKHISGYVQFFSGYGQSLIEYNHYANSAGIGFALNNWI